MKLRVLGMVVGLALVPIAARGQIVRRGPQPNEGATETVHLNTALVNKLIPLLQAESTSGANDLDAKLAARGMNKQEYVAHKNALMIARQDDLNPGRLLAIKDDHGAHQARQGNAAVFHQNKARLEVLLSKLTPEAGCTLCSGPNIPPKQTQAH